MVKAGRKALREALGRMEQLGNVALAFERDAALVAAESVAPHADRDAPGDAAPVSESQSAAHAKMLQAEVLRAQAEAKRIQAQAAAQVDRLEGALRSAEREVERFQEEKRLAEEFQRKAEAKACKAEAEVRQMKKECRDAVRAAEAETDALHKQLAEVRLRHARRRPRDEGREREHGEGGVGWGEGVGRDSLGGNTAEGTGVPKPHACGGVQEAGRGNGQRQAI